MPNTEAAGNYPNLCLEQALGDRAVAVCAECPVGNPAASCLPYISALKLVERGQTISTLEAENTNLRAENEALTGENLRLLERILGLKIDTLVSGMFTPEGLRDEIEQHDPVIAEKLMGNNWAALQVDVRFLNFINGMFGQSPGDSFLQRSGERISSIAHGLIRQYPLGSARLRRATDTEPAAPGHTLRGDILCRRGGDEFTVILFDIDRRDVPKVVKRWREQLGVAAALRRAPDGIPFVASVGAAHVTDINPQLLAGKDAYTRYRLVDDHSNAAGIEAKKSQYQTMWKRLVRDSRGSLAGYHKPEDRAVAELFIRKYFPGFISNYEDVLGLRRD